MSSVQEMAKMSRQRSINVRRRLLLMKKREPGVGSDNWIKYTEQKRWWEMDGKQISDDSVLWMTGKRCIMADQEEVNWRHTEDEQQQDEQLQQQSELMQSEEMERTASRTNLDDSHTAIEEKQASKVFGKLEV